MELQEDKLGFKYYDIKPAGFKLCISPTELFQLKPKKRLFIRENIEVVSGSILAYSPYRNVYYLRYLTEDSDPYLQSALMNLIKDKRLYIQWSPESRSKISAHFSMLGLKYGAFVRHNELTLELDEAERTTRYDDGHKSNIRRIKQELKFIKTNVQNTRNNRGDREEGKKNE